LNGNIFNDLHGSLTGFQGHSIFEVEYLINVLWPKLQWDTNRKPYLTYGMVPCLVTLTDL